MNATRHGLSGQVIVLPAEDLQAYTKFRADYHKFHTPVGPVETQCVQFRVDSAWKMNRVRACQDQILCIQSADSSANLSAENDPQLNAALAIAEAVANCTKELSNLSLHEQRHFRTFERSHDRLLMLRAQGGRTEENGGSRAAIKAAREGTSRSAGRSQKANALHLRPNPTTRPGWLRFFKR